jgi:hypothetical protein
MTLAAKKITKAVLEVKVSVVGAGCEFLVFDLRKILI